MLEDFRIYLCRRIIRVAVGVSVRGEECICSARLDVRKVSMMSVATFTARQLAYVFSLIPAGGGYFM
jgi:hypothetical protein